MFIDSTFTTMSREDNNKCKIKLGILKDYNDGSNFIIQLADYNKEEDKIDVKETKGIKWTNYYTEDVNDVIYYKGTTINDRALVLEYRIGKGSTENICDAYYLTIMESLNLKEE